MGNDKRCYNTAEALAYLGIKRRSFEQHIAPHCTGVPIGTSKVWERVELDAAWEKYKIAAGGERPGVAQGVDQWDAPKQPVSRTRRPGITSTKSTAGSGFSSVASLILHQRKSG